MIACSFAISEKMRLDEYRKLQILSYMLHLCFGCLYSSKGLIGQRLPELSSGFSSKAVQEEKVLPLAKYHLPLALVFTTK